MLLTCVLYFACLFLLQLLAALLCNVLSVSTEDTGTQMMRGNVLGPKSTAVLIVVVFASTLSFFFLVGRYTTLYSQQTEGVVGMCARRSVGCCCLRNDVGDLVVRKQRRRSSIVVPAAAAARASASAPTATSPETSQAVLYASYKMQNHMRFAVQQRLKQRLAERAAGKVTDEDGVENNNNTMATTSRPHMARRGKSFRTLTVESIQQNHNTSRTMAVQAIQRKQSARRQSVQARVVSRNKAKRSNALQKCNIFSDLDAASIATIIDKMEYEAVTAGTPIVTQGDVANTFYLILSGTCDVVINDIVVASLKELQVFGESALLQDALRVATVVAAVDVQVLRLSKQKLEALLRSGTLTSECVRKIQKVAMEREVENRKKKGGEVEQEIIKVKELLIQALKSKKTLQAFIKKADKRGTGYVSKKYVRKLLQSVETKFKVTATIDFDIVWRSMTKMNNKEKEEEEEEEEEEEDNEEKKMVKSIVLEEWLFGESTMDAGEI